MSDPITTSRAARESLSRGLNALQGDPSLPPALIELAAPIAQAMAALHQVEQTKQVQPHATQALEHVRAALAALQAAPAQQAAVMTAMESVAQALGAVNSLASASVAPAAAQVPSITPIISVVPDAAPAPPPVPKAAPAAPVAPAPQADPFAAPAAGAAPMGGATVAIGPAAAAQAQSAVQAAHAAAAAAPAVSNRPPLPPPAADTVLADLGAHSPTNFYKGLSGNDVIDHGGIFVSTYKIPKLGSTIRMRISLPGGYEVEAGAVVRWTREDSGDAPPGFGAQLTDVSAEARQLIYRYVRNREPLFYDDL